MSRTADASVSLRTVPSAVVMQPTTVCNLACDYCYLPAAPRNHMAPAVGRRVALTVNRWVSEGHPVRVFWHCGEPLAAGRDRLAALLEPFSGAVVHGVQTNATLVDDVWCRFFRERGIEVSVSIDGPETLDAHRRDRGGRPAHPRVLAGIAALRRHRVPFGVLAVVSDPTPETAQGLYDFVADLGATRIGVSLQQSLTPAGTPSGAHSYGRCEEFWLALLEAWMANPVMRVREIDNCVRDARRLLADRPDRPDRPRTVDPLPTIGWNGDVVLVAPELLGHHDADRRSFSSGNVLTSSLDAVIGEAVAGTPWIARHLVATRECVTSCRYGPLCSGPSPATSFFETRTIGGGPTDHCRGAVMARADAITFPLVRAGTARGRG
ncbi:hypothetical protein GCM10009547_23640 [Sporichthya brevicatena]|uniref:Radical SAM core domain-containing protein n=1 Tax=Sporichthya brevicatena TaxID=171442 RepID=A0ABN1GUV1_9ACTN